MALTRAEKVRAIAACEALASELRADLGAAAKAELAEEGSAATYKVPNFGTLSVAVTSPSVRIGDPEAFMKWVKARHPEQVYELREERVREAWQRGFLAEIVGRGADLCDEDGEVIPGLAYSEGGEYKCISLKVQPAVVDHLRGYAREIAAGRLPLALPGSVEP